MNEAVLLSFADIDKGCINARQHIFNSAEVHIADLVAALGHHQFIHTVIGEHCGDAQLLGDDDLLRHGRSGEDLLRAGRGWRDGVALCALHTVQTARPTSPMQGKN